MMLAESSILEVYLAQLELKHPASQIDLSLSRLQPVIESLGLAHWTCPVITVAGTNGKGSVVATCQALAKSAGIRLAAYTSPHLHRFNERFIFDGHCIEDAQLCMYLQTVETISQEVPLTQFEQLTLAALLFFKACQPDGIVLEVGMGGEFDAVNCVDADVAVVTSIDYDHMQWLGPTLADIARAKAGIFRPRQHVVLSQHAAHPVLLETAQKLGAYVHQENVTFTTYDIPTKPDWLEEHNMSVAIRAMQLAWPHRFEKTQSLVEGIAQAVLPGRLEVLNRNPLILVDVAHNVQSAERLAAWCEKHPVAGVRYVLWGSLKDKEMEKIVQAVKGSHDHWWIAPCSLKPNPRVASVSQLEVVALNCKLSYRTFETPMEAFSEALARLKPNDRLVVFGNFEWVGQFRQAFVSNHFSSYTVAYSQET
jgi:dihydrofolate synthase/folylpolyglutamate synthase